MIEHHAGRTGAIAVLALAAAVVTALTALPGGSAVAAPPQPSTGAAIVPGAAPVSAALVAAAPAPAAVSVTASGLPWSSGAYTAHSAATATAFAAWRGRPLDNITVFTGRSSWSDVNNAWYLSSSSIPAGFTGDIVASVPLWPQNSNVSANADPQWRTFARQLAAKDPNAYVRLGWEMNIANPYWKVTTANRAQWVAAFNRAVTAMHSVAPQLRIVFNPNWGYDQNGVDSRALFQDVKAGVSVFAIDMYDAYPADTNDWNAVIRWFGKGGLADSLDFAKANGVKFALPEWGVACNGAGCQWAGNTGGDNPRYINETLSFLSRYSSAVAFDSYFNEPASYLKSELYPATTNPHAGAAYRTAISRYAIAR